MGGEGICVDAAAEQLKKVIHDLPQHDRFDVHQFRDKLRGSGLVEREIDYPAAPPTTAP